MQTGKTLTCEEIGPLKHGKGDGFYEKVAIVLG